MRNLRGAASRARRLLLVFGARQNGALLALLALAVTLPAALFGMLALQEREALLREGEQVAIRTVSSIASHADKVLETHSLLLEQVDQQIRGRAWEEIEGDQRLRETLSAIVRKFPQVRSIRLIDAEGRVRQFGYLQGNAAPTDLSVAHRSYFAAHRQGATERLYISDPFVSRVDGARQFSVSVRRTTGDGRFDGVISAAVGLNFFTDFWKRVVPKVDYVIPLIKADGTVLVRHPAATQQPARLAPTGPYMQQIARAPEGGFYSAVSNVDGVERMNAYLPVGSYPLYVSYSMDKHAWLGNWRRRAVLYALLALLTTAALASVALMALRKGEAERQSARQRAAEVRRREKLEAQLVQAQKMEIVGQLTGGVAHDFNNLLHAMGLNVAFAQRQDPPASIAKCLENVKRSVDRATQLTQQLTAFSRRQRLEPRSFEPVALIVRMADLLNRTLGGNIVFEIDAAADVNPVFADPTQTELAILNLAVNARDAMPQGGSLKIRVRNAEVRDRQEVAAGHYVEFTVADTGTGMPPDVRDRAFEPFFTTKEIGKGTGLGLSMVHGFVGQSGGAISIQSSPGHGTAVTFLLPRGERVTSAQADGAAEPGASRWGGRVLLVDDDSLVRAAMHVALAEAGYDVEEAGSGEQALEILRHSRPDVLVTDYAMPALNGLRLAELARLIHPAMPIVLVSGYTEQSVGHAAGVNAILHKPFRNDELVRSIEALLCPASQEHPDAASGPAQRAIAATRAQGASEVLTTGK